MGYMIGMVIGICVLHIKIIECYCITCLYRRLLSMDTELKEHLVGTYCVCNNVCYNELSDVIRNMKLYSIEQVKTVFVVCNKCRLCESDILKIIRYHKTNE